MPSTIFLRLFITTIGSMAAMVVALFVLAIPRVAYAQITFDGTVGPINPPGFGGPNYLILQGFGQTQGATVFHSFSDFNIHTDESATFAVDTKIINVISRVTGGNSSLIDGRLSVEDGVDGANFWMINPAGMMFGENSVIDVGGTFNVGAADYLTFTDDDLEFSAIDNSVTLSVANPKEFGFLDNGGGIGSLSFESQTLDIDSIDESLTLAGRDVSLNNVTIKSNHQSLGFSQPELTIIGNRITLKDSILHLANTVNFDGGEITMTNVEIDTLHGSIHLNGGEISLSHTDLGARWVGSGFRRSSGVIRLIAENDVTIKESSAQGSALSIGALNVVIDDLRSNQFGFYVSATNNITLNDIQLSLDSRDATTGSIFIVAGNVIAFNNSVLRSGTSGQSRISGDVTIEAQGEIQLLNNSEIISTTAGGAGKAGNIKLFAPRVTIVQSKVSSESGNIGTGANIDILGTNLELTGSTISSRATGQGLVSNAGTISIGGTESQTVALMDDTTITATTLSPNGAGAVSIQGDRILSNVDAATGAVISDAKGVAITSTSLNEYSGPAGSISLVGDSIDLSNTFVSATTASDNLNNASASVDIRGTSGDLTLLDTQVEASTSAASSAGSVSLEAINVLIGNGSQIAVQTSGSGNAGNVLITTLGSTVTLDNATVQATSSGAGAGGGITVDAGNLFLKNRSSISSQASGAGAAGNIVVDLDDNLSIFGDPFTSSRISTNASQSRGGDIELRVGGKLDMLYGLVQATAGADGNGGDVKVSADNVSMQHSGILARADGGNGGSINLTVTGANQLFIADSQSIINADSDSGTSGDINVNVPDADLDSGLQEQDANIVAAAQLAPDTFSPTANRTMSTLIQDDEGGTPESPDRYLSAMAQTRETTSATEIVSDDSIRAIALLAFVQRNSAEECR